MKVHMVIKLEKGKFHSAVGSYRSEMECMEKYILLSKNEKAGSDFSFKFVPDVLVKETDEILQARKVASDKRTAEAAKK